MIANVQFPRDLVLRRKREAPKDEPEATERPPSRTEFFTEHTYSVEYEEDGERRVYTVPKGFSTDLASVPRGFRNIASRLDGIEASVIHDHAYATGSMPRADADRLFLALLEASGVSWLKRRVMYSAVRAGGWLAYEGEAIPAGR